MGVSFGLLFAIFSGYFVWLFFEAQKVRWIVDLVGGEENLKSSIQPSFDEDALYIQALQLSPDEQMYERIRALKLCKEISDACLTVSLSVANFMLINTADVRAARNVVEGYGRYNILRAQPCPAKYEISVVIKDVEFISTLTKAEAKRFAEGRLRKIEADGGLVFSLSTPECRRYFAASPYIARGYLAHVAFLVRAAQGKASSAWLYLLSRPGVYSILKKEGVLNGTRYAADNQ
ncbi:hypothetical protein [Pseudomonas sp. FEN]|uniref:hypothetical protein n=1 Tax=Pseudomonas sp. FEN TaxID=2767468 RepID=UPI00174AEA5E|nr:hypothetical protein [Pseudomonas sp. FEN]